jgi:serine/threonine protein kinase
MSPEAVAREYNSKADVWSAGILCFQLLAGRYPYWSTSKIPPETTLDQANSLAEIGLTQSRFRRLSNATICLLDRFVLLLVVHVKML